MPAKSEKQRKFMALAYAVKKGDIPKGDVSKDVLDASKSLSKKELSKMASKKEVTDELKKEATTTGSVGGSYETPMFLSKADMKKLEDLKEKRMDITLKELYSVVKKTLIREEVYSETPSSVTGTNLMTTGESKGKDTSTKNAKKTKVYDSSAAKTTSMTTKETGQQSKKATKEAVSKVENVSKPNLTDQRVIDVNANKLQNDDQRIEAGAFGMQDLEYESISPEQQKKNTELVLNNPAMDSPNSQDTGVNQQFIDDVRR